MASFRQHGNRWQARVRRKGYPDITKSFTARQDAERWARGIETSLDRATYVDPTEAEKVTFSEVISRLSGSRTVKLFRSSKAPWIN